MLLIIFEVLINVFLCSQANCINATVALSPVQEINKVPYIFLHPPPSPSPLLSVEIILAPTFVPTCVRRRKNLEI